MRVEFKVFKSMAKSWDALFGEAADFASQIGPDRLITISHSEGREGAMGFGVITVWYWDQPPKK